LNLLKSPKQPIADTESIEQMKILELAMGLGAIELDVSFPSVNLAKDVEEVIAILTSHQEQIKLLNTTLQD
jgi:CMP-2-keto-3-deoxyoctulosonic acid synthetase